MMKYNLHKTFSSTLVVFAFLIIAFGSGESKETENTTETENSEVSKTVFNTKDDLWSFIKYSNYDDLKSVWGNGRFDNLRDASSVGELDMTIDVYWDNILCEGQPIKITFKNIGISNPNPSSVDSYCLKSNELCYN
ncbi:hypothetical protein [Flavobacterium sp. RSSB_23]|uniref:hypothetical protein n=1 Tax=Flavobacterium sp. RSSB_23 TaxID=3447668 RepID=UPI003F2BF104